MVDHAVAWMGREPMQAAWRHACSGKTNGRALSLPVGASACTCWGVWELRSRSSSYAGLILTADNAVTTALQTECTSTSSSASQRPVQPYPPVKGLEGFVARVFALQMFCLIACVVLQCRSLPSYTTLTEASTGDSQTVS
jgi:DMSO reductase anchor subunit